MPKDYFSMEKMWNDILVATRQRKNASEPRDYIWAGEIGKNHWERYQRMMGVAPTEELEERVLRKFAAGEIFEELVGRELSRVGLIRSSQERIEIPATDSSLKITGKIDYVAGIVDWSGARAKIEAEPEGYTKDVLLALVDSWKENFTEGFADTVLEIKTINSLVFWAKKDYLQEAYPHHVMQLYTYLKAKNLPVGKIIYLSKDDMTIKEMVIMNPSEMYEDVWQKDVQAMTHYIRNGIEPRRPESIIFDPRGSYTFQKNNKKYKTKGCWKENWEVEWSTYFTLLTGLTEEKWKASLKSEISKLNAQLKEEYINKFKL